ncbi:MAG: adenine-specific methyltransferase EcoRI family protein [Bacteroidales bacterium]|nr:adenine-specific methyltransferase EcoRI family protein [Bacteroidales bacterium]
MANTTLTNAREAKQDEFYTQYYDIEREVEAYLDYNPDVFRGKTVLLPCDDPEWSNFTKYFAQNFERLGLKKLISTSYAIERKQERYGIQLSLFETEFETRSPQYDKKKTRSHGKIFVLERDASGDGYIDINDLQWQYLKGDGDFRSEEVTKLRDEADVIVTNPPFSLFREFFAWIIDTNKQFLLISNKNCVTYKEIFPFIKSGRMWTGKTSMSQDILFGIPKELQEQFITNGKAGSKYKVVNGVVLGRSPSVWFTNLDHGRRHQPLELMTMSDNLKYSKHKDLKAKNAYIRYDNYDAIEVPYTDAIPSDYNGVMGVPISFLDKHCVEQFEILNANDYRRDNTVPIKPHGLIKDKDGAIGGKPTYARILIRKK